MEADIKENANKPCQSLHITVAQKQLQMGLQENEDLCAAEMLSSVQERFFFYNSSGSIVSVYM